MGQPEVLGVLIVQRTTGNESYYTKAQIRRLLLRYGISTSIQGVSYSVNGLYSGGFLEVQVVGDLLHRQLRFRAKITPTRIHTSGMNKIYYNNETRKERSAGVTIRASVCSGPRPTGGNK